MGMEPEPEPENVDLARPRAPKPETAKKVSLVEWLSDDDLCLEDYAP
eukprot:COSAG06_NODE_41877_length_387_cov_0.538194_2_plen_46_part_01